MLRVSDSKLLSMTKKSASIDLKNARHAHLTLERVPSSPASLGSK